MPNTPEPSYSLHHAFYDSVLCKMSSYKNIQTNLSEARLSGNDYCTQHMSLVDPVGNPFKTVWLSLCFLQGTVPNFEAGKRHCVLICLTNIACYRPHIIF